MLNQAIALIVIISAYSCNHEINNNPEQNKALIEDYLENNLLKSQTGIICSSTKLLGADNKCFYVWMYIADYYKENNIVKMGEAWSVPVVLFYSKENNNKLQITSHKIPRDGDLYSQDIKVLFPKKYHQEIFDLPGTKDIENLSKISLVKARNLLN